jgi:hypothetical protein
LGQSLGKSLVTAQDMTASFELSWNSIAYLSQSKFLNIASITSKFDGRFSGDFTTNNISALSTTKNPGQVTNTVRKVANLFVSILKVELQLLYQYERIIILHFGSILCDGADTRIESGDGKGQFETQIHVTVDQLRLIISRRTFPTFNQLLAKIKRILLEKIQIDSLKSKVRWKTPMQFTDVHDIYGQNRDIGKININFNHIFINFMRQHFRDPEFAQGIILE